MTSSTPLPVPLPVSAAEAKRLIAEGATLVDVRGADEHARERIAGAVNRPLGDPAPLPAGPLIFHCRSGARTDANAARLAAAAGGAPCYRLAGGLDGWRAAGLPTLVDRRQPIEIMRQVQLVAGALVLAGVLLGAFVAPPFLGLAGFVGAGLMVAGATGWCGMARLLAALPWNRAARAG